MIRAVVLEIFGTAVLLVGVALAAWAVFFVSRAAWRAYARMKEPKA